MPRVVGMRSDLLSTTPTVQTSMSIGQVWGLEQRRDAVKFGVKTNDGTLHYELGVKRIDRM